MDKENQLNNTTPWWKPAVKIFMDVSTWVVVPIILAIIFGKMLDAHYHTQPMYFLILTGVAFFVSCVGIVKVMKNYMKKFKEDFEKENKK